MRLWLLLFTLFAVQAQAQAPDEISEEECQALSDSLRMPYHFLCTTYIGGVTPIQLVSNPSEYDGRIIAAWGAIRLDLESSALYLPELDYPSLEVWLTYAPSCRIKLPERRRGEDLLPCDAENLEAIEGRRVFVQGRYSRNKHGHMGMYPGTIAEVDWIAVQVER